MYEDAGNDKNYASEYALTELSNSWDGNVQTIRIAPRTGSYEGMPAERSFKVKVLASAAPAEVKVNGAAACYEYEDFSFVVEVPLDDCAAEKVITVSYAGEDTKLDGGIIGLSRRMARSIEALKFRTGSDPIDDLAMMGTICEAAQYAPENAPALEEAFMKNYKALPEILSRQRGMKEDDIQWFLKHCGWNL